MNKTNIMTQEWRGPKFKFYKDLLIGISLMVVGFLFWRQFAGNPINDLRLVINGKIVSGYITKVSEFETEYEKNDRVYSGFQHVVRYYYVLPDGVKVFDSASFGGRTPQYLVELRDNPYKVEVEYLPSNPKIHKIKDFDFMNFKEWFLRKFLAGGIMLIFSLSIGFVVVRNAIKKYNESKTEKDP